MKKICTFITVLALLTTSAYLFADQHLNPQSLANQTMTDLFSCCEEFNQRYYQGELRIPVSQDLSDLESIQEAQFAADLQVDLQEAVERYKKMPATMGGKIIDPDAAKHLCQNYAVAATLEERARYAPSTGVPAEFFVDYMFYKELFKLVKKRKSQDEPLSLVFLAGGYGVGKTTTRSRLSSIRKADLVRDRSMDEEFSVPKAMIEAALKHRITVTVVYVYRPLEVAFNAMIDRASDEGRILPIIRTATAHWQAQDNVRKLHQHFGNRINIVVVNNENALPNPEIVEDGIAFINSEKVIYHSQQDAIDRILKEYNSLNKTGIPQKILYELEKDLDSAQQKQAASETEGRFWNKIMKFVISSWFSSEQDY